jgi:hypothetical protein
MLRGIFLSIVAVIAGIIVLAVVSFGIEAAADPLMIHFFPRAFPDASALQNSVPAQLVMFAYTFLAVMAGGYVTAWISRHAPVRDAVIMGVIEAALTVWLLTTRFHQAPLTSLVKAVIVCVPSAWLGGVLRARGPTTEASAQAS